MSRISISTRKIGFLGLTLAALLAVSLACGAEATPTPKPVATAAPAPTAAPVPAATSLPTAAPAPIPSPTPVAAPAPTATRVPATPTTTVEQIQYGGTLRFAIVLEATNFDPSSSVGVPARYIMHSLYNKLVGYSPAFEIIPDLAKSWDFSGDGKSITFRLQEGGKFHDGTPLDANAVKWNLEHQMDPNTFSRNRTELEPIESIKVLDSSTIILNLKSASRPILSVLGDRAGMLISPTAFQTLGKDYGARPVGSGPFKFKTWVLDSYVTVERNPNYWQKGVPYLDAVRLDHVADRSVQLAMLRTGEADMIERVTGSDVKIMESHPNLKTVPHESGRFYAVQLAVDTSPWNNVALRHALAYALDRETILKVYYDGLGRVAHTPLGTGWAYNPTIKIFELNAQKAKAKLTEAGYPNGIKADMHCVSTTSELRLCEIVQAQAATVGINLSIVPVLATDQGRLTLSRVQLVRMTNWSPRADPDGLLRILFYSKAQESRNHGYKNPEVDKLLDQAAPIYDIAKAKPIYDQVQKIVAEDGPYIYTIWRNELVALDKKVQGFVWIPDLIVRFQPMWIKR